MRHPASNSLMLTIFCFLTLGNSPVHPEEPRNRLAPDSAVGPARVRKAVERGLGFLEKDAARWRKERQCATCHHGTMTVWAFAEAKSEGYTGAADILADASRWTRERLESIDKPRDPRPGWKMVSTPAIYLALMAQTVPKQ